MLILVLSLWSLVYELGFGNLEMSLFHCLYLWLNEYVGVGFDELSLESCSFVIIPFAGGKSRWK